MSFSFVLRFQLSSSFVRSCLGFLFFISLFNIISVFLLSLILFPFLILSLFLITLVLEDPFGSMGRARATNRIAQRDESGRERATSDQRELPLVSLLYARTSPVEILSRDWITVRSKGKHENDTAEATYVRRSSPLSSSSPPPLLFRFSHSYYSTSSYRFFGPPIRRKIVSLLIAIFGLKFHLVSTYTLVTFHPPIKNSHFVCFCSFLVAQR